MLVSEGQWSLERWAMGVFSILTPSICCCCCFFSNITSTVLCIPTGCPRSQFSSNTMHLELGIRSHQGGRDLVPWDCTYFLCQLQVLGHPLWLTDCKSRVFMTPSLGLVLWYNGSSNLRKHVTCLCWFIIYLTVCVPRYYSPLGSSRQEYWSGLPFPPPGDLPKLEIEPTSPVSPALQVDSLPTAPLGKLFKFIVNDTTQEQLYR